MAMRMAIKRAIGMVNNIKEGKEKKNNFSYGKNIDAFIDNQIHDLQDFSHKQNKSQNE